MSKILFQIKYKKASLLSGNLFELRLTAQAADLSIVS